jgi:O-antigen/teichoic acid export membrane protein
VTLYLPSEMGSKLLWRRSAAAAGLYASGAFGILGTVVAARVFGLREFGLYATVMVATGFFQTMLDLTVEESLIKYGFRYATAEDWGRLRRLFARALQLKLAGGLLAGGALLALAPLADRVFDTHGLAWPLVLAAALPLVQAPENVAGTAILLRGRYDLRGGLQTLSMALRLAAIVIGSQLGLTETIAAILIAQALATAAVSAVGVAAFRRFPAAPSESLEADSEGLRAFVLQSSAATGLLSLRSALAPLLLGVVAGPVQVGLFRLAQAPQAGYATLSSPVRLIMLTEQTQDWERGEIVRVLRGVRRYTRVSAAITAVALLPLLLVMPNLIESVFGAKYLGAVDAARLVLVAASIQLVLGWTKSFPVSIGRPNLRLITHGAETVVLIPLVVVFGLEWGATGAALAVVVSTAVFAAAWAIVYARVSRSSVSLAAAREVVAP